MSSDRDPLAIEHDDLATAIAKARPDADAHAQLIRANVAARLFEAPAETVRVARFVLLERLGRGAMGDVFAAYDPKLDRKVAVKLVPGEGNPASSEALLTEARAAARLVHPGVVTVHDAGEHGRGVYVAMELVAGASLRAWAEGRAWREVLVVARQIARALAAAHRAGVVHRDIKPENILIQTDDAGRPAAKITDFGLAIISAAAAAAGRAGSPAYMAPEIRRGGEPSAAADQYACCVTLWEAFTGRRPDAEPAPHGLPPRLAATLARGFADDPARRFPSMDALADALDADPRRGRRRWMIAGGGIAACAIGAAVAWTVSRGARVDACAHAGDDAAATWPARRAAVVAMIRSAPGFGEASAATTDAAVERWATAWRRARVDGCRDLRRGARADVTHAAITACLDRQRVQVDHALASLARGPDAARTAVDATARLPDPAACALPNLPAPPLDPQARARHDELLARVARAAAEIELGRADAAAAELGDAEAAAAQLGHDPVRAAVLATAGAIAQQRGGYEEARTLLERAALAGIAGGDPRATAAAATRLVYVVAAGLRLPTEVERWIQMAEAALVAAGGDVRTSAALRDHVGVAHALAARFDDAIAAHREALAQLERAYGPDHPDRVGVLINLATAHHKAERYAEALPHYDAAEALAARVYGARHPVLGPLLSNRAMARWELADREGVLADLELALVIKEAANGPTHPGLASTLTNLGLVLGELDRLAEAAVPLERAVRIREAALGAQHPALLNMLINLAVTYIELARLPEARATAGRALAIAEAGGAPGAVFYPATLAAWVEVEAGRLADARRFVAQADRALAASESTDAVERAHLDFAAARALSQQTPSRARERARAALAAFRADQRSPSSPRFARAVEAWLATHGG